MQPCCVLGGGGIPTAHRGLQVSHALSVLQREPAEWLDRGRCGGVIRKDLDHQLRVVPGEAEQVHQLMPMGVDVAHGLRDRSLSHDEPGERPLPAGPVAEEVRCPLDAMLHASLDLVTRKRRGLELDRSSRVPGGLQETGDQCRTPRPVAVRVLVQGRQAVGRGCALAAEYAAHAVLFGVA